jgi:predicted O-methyltransferase YrrM
LGLGTSALALGNPTAHVFTVEGCPVTSARAQEMFKEFELNNIRLHNETFDEFFAKDTTKTYDLVYIDGNHSKERTLQYFEMLLKKTHNDSIIILDDIYWSRSMTEAWEQIIKHPEVTVSIDTYQWGILFFRKEQEKQHFCIRV